MLYIVATPIGNLQDITLRALDVLKQVDVIACEDTRNTQKLLNFYNISQNLISYHKFNEKVSAQGIVKLLKDGKNVALVSDGGMPLISDPGNVLTQLLKDEQIEYTVIPGANAALCALILSGLDTSRFTFVGFLPEKQSQKEELLTKLQDREETLIFHVSCHNVQKDLQIIQSVLGRRKACLVKEISKIHETAINFNLGDEVSVDERGEFILVVEGLNKNNQKIIENNSKIIENNSNFNNYLINQVINFQNLGLSKNEAIKIVAKENKVNREVVYNLFNKN